MLIIVEWLNKSWYIHTEMRTITIHSNNDDHNKHNFEQKKIHSIHIKNKNETNPYYWKAGEWLAVLSQRVWKEVGKGKADGVLTIFCSLMHILITGVCSIYENSLNYPFKKCVFSYTYIILQKEAEKKTKKKMPWHSKLFLSLALGSLT